MATTNGMAARDKTRTNGSTSADSRKGSVSNSATIDADNPIPIEYNGGIFTTTKGKQYVPFLNPKDNFGQLLTEAKLLSPTTLTCVSSKVQYCLGKGIHFCDVKDPDTNKDIKLFKEWSASVNRKQESCNDILRGGFDGKLTAGNGYIEIVRGEVGKKRFVKLYNRSFLDCRLSLPDDDDICNTVFFSKQFRRKNWSFKELECAEVPLWSPNNLDRPWWKDEKGFQHTMFHLKNDVSGYDYYGMPSNVASLPQQILEYKAARYNLDNFDNNLVIGGIVVLKGSVTEEEAVKLGKKIIYTHTGDGKRGRWVILSSESGAVEGAEIKPFEKKMEGSYIEMDEHTEEKIYVANKWNKLLVGGSEKKSIGQGNSAYIRSVYDIANNTVIIPEQEYMVTKFVRPLLRICDEWMGTNWSQYEVCLKSVQPVSFLGDIDVNAITTKDEGRAIIGKEPLGGERGESLIKESKSAAPKTDTNVQD